MKKKGFTLIELLAVIVILAIIALIATPIILSMINNARKSAAKSSTYGFIEAIDSNNGFADADIAGYTKIADGTHNVSEISVPMKGKAPDSGSVEIEKGKVKTANICINGFTVTYNGHEAEVGSKCDSSAEPEVEFNGTYVAPTTGQTHKGIVYMDPTDLTATCTASNSVSTTGTKTGCMKFYIYDDSGDTYKMILDHNTTAKVAYNSIPPYVAYENATIKTKVEQDTAGWVGSPRLITAQDIVTITNTTTFDGSNSTWFFFNGTGTNKQTQASSSQGDNEYAWLFDYTKNCTSYGCNAADSSTSGYWTSSSVSDNSSNAGRVGSNGSFYGDRVNYNFFGVRPVITLKKSIIN